ncbi:MAG: rhomboid family intramembrane serine protease [Treponema sp.]
MPQKKGIFTPPKIRYDAPVTLTFVFIAAAVLAADAFLHKGIIAAFFTAGGSHKSTQAFNIAHALDYARLFFHVFGHTDWLHFTSSALFILLLGPAAEEEYGSPLLALMIFVSAAVAGVLNACFSPVPLNGSASIAFLMSFLFLFSKRKKNELPLSLILIFVLFAGKIIAGMPNGIDISALIQSAGGLSGSAIALFAVPKRRAKTKNAAKDAVRSRRKNPQPDAAPEASDDTVIGAL